MFDFVVLRVSDVVCIANMDGSQKFGNVKSDSVLLIIGHSGVPSLCMLKKLQMHGM